MHIHNAHRSIILLVLAIAWPYSTDTHAQAENIDAAEIYHQYCSVCHGDRGDGRSRARQGLIPPPRDFTSAESIAALSRERMLRGVLDGRPGTAMTGWRTRLSNEQALAVVDYIRSRFMQQDTASDDTTADIPGTGTPAGSAWRAPRGDFEAGAVLYAANCSACHGISGQGNGPRAYFIFPKPRNFTAEQTREVLDRERLFLAVSNGVQGREMPAWRHVFSERQLADVSEYVYRAFLRPGTSPASR
jgi:mono/diheme cytochrome c family protein